MIRLIQQVCLVTMSSTQKIRIWSTVGVAYKMFSSCSYFVVVDRLGEGSSEKNSVLVVNDVSTTRTEVIFRVK